MDYFVTFNGDTSLWEHNYDSAQRLAEKYSKKYGKATIICQEMQVFKIEFRKVATRTWEESYINGVCEKRTPLNTRLSDRRGIEIPIDEWNAEMEEILKEMGYKFN